MSGILSGFFVTRADMESARGSPIAIRLMGSGPINFLLAAGTSQISAREINRRWNLNTTHFDT